MGKKFATNGDGANDETSGKTSEDTTSGKSNRVSGKSSGKSSGKPEVGKKFATNDATDEDIELGEDIDDGQKGWRLEQNSNGYWRWRWQLKDDEGDSITYVNKTGKTGYKRGSKYVKINESR